MRTEKEIPYRRTASGGVQRGYRLKGSGKIIYPAELSADGENGNGQVAEEQTPPTEAQKEKKFLGMPKKTGIIVTIGLIIVVAIVTRKYHKLF